MTNIQKKEIMQLIEDEKQRLGSYRAVAKKCNISEATISQLRSESYQAEGDEIYYKIADALGYDFDDSSWKIATDITDFRIIQEVLNDAKLESMFIGVSDNAGCGKTATSNTYLNWYKKKGVFKLNCKEWAGRVFLTNLAIEIGAELPKGYASVNDLIECIADATRRMAHLKPLYIIDQANSLRSSAICSLIHIFNECEDILGLVMFGTENLEKEIKRGVKLQKKGYDELDSRFGRKYIRTFGTTLADCRKICDVNGVSDKTLQEEIFKAAEPIKHTITEGEMAGKSVLIIKDKRRLKRIIKRERLKLNKHAY